MSVMETLKAPGSWTVADRDALPDDPLHRYEVIDGFLFVSAAPRPAHQQVVVLTWRLLFDAAPEHLHVYAAPLDIVLADDTVVEPDVLVAPRDAFTEKNLPSAPLLAVEVLSPSTRDIDLEVKKNRYLRAGIASYWLIDPDVPRLTAYELDRGEYVRVAEVAADETWTATRPFEVAITPAALRY